MIIPDWSGSGKVIPAGIGPLRELIAMGWLWVLNRTGVYPIKMNSSVSLTMEPTTRLSIPQLFLEPNRFTGRPRPSFLIRAPHGAWTSETAAWTAGGSPLLITISGVFVQACFQPHFLLIWEIRQCWTERRDWSGNNRMTTAPETGKRRSVIVKGWVWQAGVTGDYLTSVNWNQSPITARKIQLSTAPLSSEPIHRATGRPRPTPMTRPEHGSCFSKTATCTTTIRPIVTKSDVFVQCNESVIRFFFWLIDFLQGQPPDFSILSWRSDGRFIAFPNRINTLIKTQAKLIGSAWCMLDSS